MAEYDVTDLDLAVSYGLALGDRTEWVNGEHRFVMTDQDVLAILTDEYGSPVATEATAILRSGRVRLLHVPPADSGVYPISFRVGEDLGWRRTIVLEAQRAAAREAPGGS